MAARRQVTNKLRSSYRRASKAEKGRILDEVMETTGLCRSSARRLLVGPALPRPSEQVDRRSLKPRGFSDDARELLEHAWMLMDMPCGKYFVVMWPQWFPLLAANGEFEKWDDSAVCEVTNMSAATVDRYLAPARATFALRGKSATSSVPPALRNSIAIRKATDELDGLPGNVEADTVAHCGPTLIGDFARTVSLTDIATGWTECESIPNNAMRWIVNAVDDMKGQFPFPIRNFDSDNGSEFINKEVAKWLQAQDIEWTRSRPYQKNDQATIESKNYHVVRKRGFYWRYDTPEEVALLNQLWELVGIRQNYFTPTRKPIGYSQTADGRRQRIYDKPATPWQRAVAFEMVTAEARARAEEILATVNPADLTRKITRIQSQLTELAKVKTTTMMRGSRPNWPLPGYESTTSRRKSKTSVQASSSN